MRETTAPYLAPLMALALAASLAGCTIGDASGRDPGGRSATAAARPAPTTNPGGPGGPGAGADGAAAARGEAARPSDGGSPERPAPADPAGDALAGKVIYLDPGHAAVMPEGNPQVTDGRGGSKPCQVPGTAAMDGWPEHTFNWLVALELRARLEARGATVLMTRGDDSGPAPCIDERARLENASLADAVVSLHADGSAEGNRGFHVITVADPLPGNDAERSGALAAHIRDAFVAGGFAPSNYLGVDGIDRRSDLTGLNLSTKPKVLVEFGNMRDSADIAELASPEGRARMAEAVAAGVAAALGDGA